MKRPIDDAAMATLFTQARTFSTWLDKPISDELLERLYMQTCLGPTSANCSPGRFVFVRSDAGREKLRPCLSKGNLEKTMSAPTTVIVAYDSTFYDDLPELFPHADARSWFTGSPALAKETAFRNSSLQAGYLIIAARAMGLDTGPMSGFDAALLDKTFFSGTTWKSNLLINLGYGDPDSLHPRLPRLAFHRACQLV